MFFLSEERSKEQSADNVLRVVIASNVKETIKWQMNHESFLLIIDGIYIPNMRGGLGRKLIRQVTTTSSRAHVLWLWEVPMHAAELPWSWEIPVHAAMR